MFGQRVEDVDAHGGPSGEPVSGLAPVCTIEISGAIVHLARAESPGSAAATPFPPGPASAGAPEAAGRPVFGSGAGPALEPVVEAWRRAGYRLALEQLAPGPQLATRVSQVELADLPDLQLSDTLAACGGLKAWVASLEAKVIAETARRTDPILGESSEFLVDEVAATLGTTGRAAAGLVDRAAFLQAFPEVHDALSDGRLTERKVDVLSSGTDHLATDEASRVLAAVLPRADRLTPPALREAVRRADVAEDPARAAARAARAKRERCVWMEPAPDSMAFVRALLPAADAVRVMTGLDAVAAAAAPEDERTLDQRRADALTDLVGVVLDRGVTPDGTPLATRHGRRPHLQITATLEAVAGLTETPAELARYGPVPAVVAREIAATAAWTAVVVDPRTGEVAGRSSRTYRPTAGMAAAVLSRDVTCTFPGCRVPAERCDLDHMEPHRPDGGDEQTRAGNLTALCRHHHRMKTHGGWTVERDHHTGVTTWRSRLGKTYTRDPRPAPIEPVRGSLSLSLPRSRSVTEPEDDPPF